jgi:hypothetical protein
MPLNREYESPFNKYISYKLMYESLTSKNVVIDRIMYSDKIAHFGYEKNLYKSIDISMSSYNDSKFEIDEFIYYSICPMETNFTEHYIGDTFSSSRSHDGYGDGSDNYVYYNKILGIIEDFVKQSIENFTNGEFFYVDGDNL